MTAFGLTLVTPEVASQTLFDDDVQLVVPGGGRVKLRVADRTYIGSAGGRDFYGYFLGAISPSSFTSATLTYGADTPAAGFLFNVEDLLAVPEPGRPLALVAGWLLLAALQRLRRPQK